MTDHEALEALVKIAGEIPISAYPGKSYDERSHNAVTMVETLIDLSKALRTGQLIPAPSGDDARITALEASLAEARRQALEEAAKACEAHMSQCLDDRDIQKRWPQIKAHNAVYAGVVRALKDSPPPPTM